MEDAIKKRMRDAGVGIFVDRIDAGKCAFCADPINQDEFRDDLSRKEFEISGLCQKCQDWVFGV